MPGDPELDCDDDFTECGEVYGDDLATDDLATDDEDGEADDETAVGDRNGDEKVNAEKEEETIEKGTSTKIGRVSKNEKFKLSGENIRCLQDLNFLLRPNQKFTL